MNDAESERIMLVCSYTTGDLFRVWPGGHAALIHRESDLDEYDFIASLKPDLSCEFRFACAGLVFERVAYVECEVCGGDGLEVGPTWISEDEDGLIQMECGIHHRGHVRDAVYSEEAVHRCCRCHGSGKVYRYTGEQITRAEACKA